jgi:hypothetical protein
MNPFQNLSTKPLGLYLDGLITTTRSFDGLVTIFLSRLLFPSTWGLAQDRIVSSIGIGGETFLALETLLEGRMLNKVILDPRL